MKNLNSYIFEKLVIDKNTRTTVKVNGLAEDIVKAYFGGYIPATLEEEGMKCSSDKEIYELVEKMENFYINQEDSKDPGSEEEIDKAHKDLTEWVRKTNER